MTTQRRGLFSQNTRLFATVAWLAPNIAYAASYCSKDGGAAAVDLSYPVNASFLKKIKNIGVTTIIRYYDYKNETIKGKTLKPAERDLILRNGLKIAVVFQHHNDQFASFTAQRGKGDAARSLELAKMHSQPTGSAIYFGVDGEWKTESELDNIKTYFRNAGEQLSGSGYRVGVYGSGLVCEQLLTDGLASLCWLANAKSWPGYDDYYNSKKWSLVQTLPTNCAGRNIDFNFVNESMSDFGQFGR